MSKTIIPLTQERLREVLHYNPNTGVFTWLLPIGRRVKAGNVAGCANTTRRSIKLDSTRHLAHRLAWLYMTGSFPKQQIDHIDGDPRNNAFPNLRDIPNSINAQNRRKASVDSKTGLLGVSYSKQKRKWIAQICLNGKNRSLGHYCTPELAYAAYLIAKRIHHEGCTI